MPGTKKGKGKSPKSASPADKKVRKPRSHRDDAGSDADDEGYASGEKEAVERKPVVVVSRYSLIKKKPALDKLIAKFAAEKPHQRTASAYSPWYIADVEGSVLAYRRNQSDHAFSDVSNPASGPFMEKVFTQRQVVKEILEQTFNLQEVRAVFRETFHGDKKALAKLEISGRSALKKSKMIENILDKTFGSKRAQTTDEIPSETLGERVAEVFDDSEIERIKKNKPVLTVKGAKGLYNFGGKASFPGVVSKRRDVGKSIAPLTKTEASKRKKELDDAILDHKVVAVTEMVTALATKFPDNKNKTKTIIVDAKQIDAKYPCIIVRLNDQYPKHAEMSALDVKHQYDEAYPKFLTHLMIACINNRLCKNKVGGYIDRRQSFGFLTPTASDVGSAIRLSLGIIPNAEWKASLIQGIEDFDSLLNDMWVKKKITPGAEGEMGAPQSKFRSGEIDVYGHQLFLEQLLKDGGNEHLKTFVGTLDENYDAIKERVRDPGFGPLVAKMKLEKEKLKDTDATFNALYSRLMVLYARLNATTGKPLGSTGNTITKLMALEKEIFKYQQNALTKLATLGDVEVTSESSEPNRVRLSEVDFGELPEQLLYDKHYTPTGMSALSVALIAYQKACGNKKIHIKTEEYAYFELAGWKSSRLVKSKFDFDDVTYGTANIVFVDNNPCVNGEEGPISVADVIDGMDAARSANNQMLIVDTTSSTEKQMNDIKTKFEGSNIPFLCLAESGLKNRQAGADMGQYGKVTLYINAAYIAKLSSRERGKLINLAKELQGQMSDLTSGTSSVLATEFAIRGIRNAFTPEEDSSLLAALVSEEEEGPALAPIGRGGGGNDDDDDDDRLDVESRGGNDNDDDRLDIESRVGNDDDDNIDNDKNGRAAVDESVDEEEPKRKPLASAFVFTPSVDLSRPLPSRPSPVVRTPLTFGAPIFGNRFVSSSSSSLSALLPSHTPSTPSLAPSRAISQTAMEIARKKRHRQEGEQEVVPSENPSVGKQDVESDKEVTVQQKKAKSNRSADKHPRTAKPVPAPAEKDEGRPLFKAKTKKR